VVNIVNKISTSITTLCIFMYLKTVRVETDGAISNLTCITIQYIGLLGM